MTKQIEAFEAWWADTGEQSLYALNTTTDDDIKILAGIAWEAAIREVLAEQELAKQLFLDQATYGTSVSVGGKRIDPADFYAEPVKQEPVCKTCEALARTVMMDQTGKA